MGLSDILTTIQQGVTAVNNLGQFLGQATINSCSIRVALSSTYYITPASTNFLPSSAPVGTGTVTQINTSVGLTGGPITVSGTLAVNLSFLANSLTSNVAISSAGTYADGPIVAQGTSGTWLATGSITVTSTTGPTNIYAKLWDGTTVIDSANSVVSVANLRTTISLSGIIASPAGSIRISAADPDLIPATMEFNRTGTGKDCTVTVARIA